MDPESAGTGPAKYSGAGAQIDRLLYELYGLTEDEIKIVESG